jgi:hypothetical protein
MGQGIPVRGLAQVQVADVPRERRLSHFEASPPKMALKVLLAGDRSVLQHIEYGPLAQGFIHNA